MKSKYKLRLLDGLRSIKDIDIDLYGDIKKDPALNIHKYKIYILEMDFGEEIQERYGYDKLIQVEFRSGFFKKKKIIFNKWTTNGIGHTEKQYKKLFSISKIINNMFKERE